MIRSRRPDLANAASCILGARQIKPMLEHAKPNIKKLWDIAQSATFTFRTKGMDRLWEFVRGQITDGHWENKPGHTASLVWAWMPAKVGSKTQVKGTLPHSVKNYKLVELVQVGLMDDMLKDVQKVEADATEETVTEYLKEIEAAMRKAKRERIRAPEEEGGEEPKSDRERIRRELAWKFDLGDDAKLVFEVMMEGAVYGRQGQYHYFAIFQDPKTGDYVGGNAYGKFGKSPKSVELARGPDLDAVKSKVEKKISAKTGKYSETSRKEL